MLQQAKQAIKQRVRADETKAPKEEVPAEAPVVETPAAPVVETPAAPTAEAPATVAAPPPEP